MIKLVASVSLFLIPVLQYRTAYGKHEYRNLLGFLMMGWQTILQSVHEMAPMCGFWTLQKWPEMAKMTLDHLRQMSFGP